MVDASKVADLVLLLVDASFGFEMETFEFLNLLQVSSGRTASMEQGEDFKTTVRWCHISFFERGLNIDDNAWHEHNEFRHGKTHKNQLSCTIK